MQFKGCPRIAVINTLYFWPQDKTARLDKGRLLLLRHWSSPPGGVPGCILSLQRKMMTTSTEVIQKKKEAGSLGFSRQRTIRSAAWQVEGFGREAASDGRKFGGRLMTCIEAATREYGFRPGKSTSRKEVNTGEEKTGWLPFHHDGVKSVPLGKEGNKGKREIGENG